MPHADAISVLHVDTERGWRGGERQALWLAQAVARAGHTSIVGARPGEPLDVRARAAGLEVIACAPVTEFDPRSALRLRREIVARGVSIVHAHTGHAVTAAAMAVLGTSARVVVTRRVDFRLKRNWGTRWKYSRASALIAISHAVARALEASGIDPARIEIIPSGVDLTRTFEPASRETLAALGVPVGAPLVVQVAQLVGHKDPVTFVRAVAAARREVPTLHALSVGEGPLRGRVEAEVAALGLHDVLHLTGYRADADALLAAADVATLSSQEEGLGTVLLDALSMGKPAAATAAGGIPEIIEDGVSGLLVPVHDAAALGAAIARLLLDTGLAARLRAGALRRAADFSVERTAERTLAVYARVLARGATRVTDAGPRAGSPG
jgi:glycosyltransferase involved in cell wall biosynthesis